MNFNPIHGLSSAESSRLYMKTSSGDIQNYKLSAFKRNEEIKELEEKLEKGQITQQEYNQKKSLLESAPLYIHIEDGETKTSSTNIFKNEEKDHKKEIDKLNSQYANGEISDFTYRANMYLMNHPASDNEQHEFSTTA